MIPFGSLQLELNRLNCTARYALSPDIKLRLFIINPEDFHIICIKNVLHSFSGESIRREWTFVITLIEYIHLTQFAISRWDNENENLII